MATQSWFKGALSLLVVCGIPACAPGSDSIDDAETDRDDAIINGTTATAFPEAVLVNMFFDGQLGAYCSGSLIAPRVVLTAGHCVHGIDQWQVKAPFAQNQVANATSGETFDWNTDSEEVDPSMHDIGLVFLDTPITLASYPTIPTSHVTFGSKIQNIGRIHNGSVSTTKLYIGAQISAVDGKNFGFPFSYASNEIIESGDSGGPVVKPGTHEIVAVNSGAGGGTEVLARTDLLATWIAQEIATKGGGSSGTTTPPPASACGNITFEGTCSGNTVKWCENDQVHQLSCASSHKTCGFDSANSYYNCL